MIPPSSLRRGRALSDEDKVLVQRYAPVLSDMVEALGTIKGMTFGQALERSCSARSRPMPPKQIEKGLLRVAFELMATKKIPGAPDA